MAHTFADFADFRGTSRFEVRRRVGAGGMGAVYHVYDRDRREDVALKTLLRADPTALYLFKREFRNLAGVAHPNLVSLYELLNAEGYWFFTMELVDGVDVLQHIRTGATRRSRTTRPADRPDSTTTMDLSNEPRPAPAARAPALSPAQLDRLRAALLQISEGLMALHARGFLHRDIKPSNVLVTPRGRVVIVDFGVSRDTRQHDDTQFAPVIGTPTYMAPEQSGSEHATSAVDWYAVGVILYEALTGQPPFSGSYGDMLLAKRTTAPAPPSRVVDGVPADLDLLCVQLLQSDPGRRASGADILRSVKAHAAPTMDPPRNQAPAVAPDEFILLGRERELAEIGAGCDEVRRGRAITLVIHGSSGVGKTALLRRFRLGLAQNEPGALVLSGRCYERETVPYKAVDGIVDRLSHYLLSLPARQVAALLPRDTAALALLFPVLLRVEAVAAQARQPVAHADPLTLRRAAFGALRELLTRIAWSHQLLVLAVDDLQWADADSMALIEHLMRPPGVPPLLLLLAMRSEEIGARPFLARFVDEPEQREQRRLELKPLSVDESRSLAEHLLRQGEAQIADAELDAIARECEGSPFLLEQLAGLIAVGTEASSTSLSLGDVLARRVAQLPVGAQAFLHALAVAGRPTPPGIVLRAAGVSSDSRTLVHALGAAQMVRSSGTAEHIEVYHDRIRETLLAGLAADRTREIHARLAEALELAGSADPEALYEHYFGAGDRPRAGEAAFAAARRATTALAFDRAALFYRRSIELSALTPAEAARRTELLGAALADAGRTREAARAFLDAGQAASDPASALELRRRAAEQLLLGGHIDEGVDTVRAVLGEMGAWLPASPRQALLGLLWRRAQLRLRGLRFVEHPPDERTAEELLKVDAYWAVGSGLGVVDLVQGAYFQSTHVLLALRAGEPYRVARALAIEAASVATRGGPARERAAAILRSADALARRVELPHAHGLCALAGGIAAFVAGQWKKCTRLCDEAAAVFRERCPGATWELTNAVTFAMSGLLYQGELVAMTRRLADVMAEARDRGNLYVTTGVQTRFNILWLAAGDAARARQEVAEALARWSHRGFHRQHYNAMVAETQIELYERRPAVAREILERRWGALERSLLMRVQVLRIEAYWLRARVLLAVAARERSARRRLAVRAAADAARIRRESMFWSDPLAALVESGAARLSGRLDLALGALGRAIDGFELAGMGLYASAARLTLGELQGGDDGRRLAQDARDWLLAQHVHDPDALARMLAPALTREAS